MNELNKERLFELLADQTVFGLNEVELTELKQLKMQFPDWENDISFDIAAAAISLANLDIEKALPASMRAKVMADADKFFETEIQETNIFASRKNAGYPAAETVGSVVGTEPKSAIWQWLGWAVAATACVALALNLYVTRDQPKNDIAKQPETIQTPVPELSPSQERARLLASAADVVTKEWKSPKDESKVLGDIVWSGSQQKGYLRFRGLPANNPTKESYQLWIVDETQDKKTPVSGGVFNVAENGEVVIPIDAQLEIKKPVLFAITKEKAGGVVVSKQEEVVAVAKV